MNPPRSFPLALALTTAAACPAVRSQAPITPITPNELLAHIRFLSDDLLEGRAPGTHGDALARRYIGAQLAAVGCMPGGPDGAWTQPVPILGITSTVTRAFVAARTEGGGKVEVAYKAPDDYTAV